jgi:hypothetical protein
VGAEIHARELPTRHRGDDLGMGSDGAAVLRFAVIAASAAAVFVLIVGVKPGRTSEDQRWRQAHRAAVRYRRQRDHVQALLTRRVLQVRRLEHGLASHTIPEPILAIRLIFGPYADQAISVSSCETGGTFDTDAANGQFLGLFQMGSYARSVYGHGHAALEQTQAAFRYFVASGRDWSPWACKPDGSVR